MSQPQSTTAKTATEASELLEELEALPLGEPFAEVLSAARAAISAEEAAAISCLFPSDLAPAPANAYAALSYYRESFPQAHAKALAALHGRAIGHWPELADLVRRERLSAAIGAEILSLQADKQAAKAAAISEFECRVAQQIVDAEHQLADHARSLLTARRLATQADAVEARHRKHVADTLREREVKAAAVQRVRRAEAVRRRAEAKAAEVEAENAKKRAAYEDELKRGKALAKRIRKLGVKKLVSRRLVESTGAPPPVYGAEEIACMAERGNLSTAALEKYEAMVEDMG